VIISWISQAADVKPSKVSHTKMLAPVYVLVPPTKHSNIDEVLVAILGGCSGCLIVGSRMGRCGVADAEHVRLGSCFDSSRPMQMASLMPTRSHFTETPSHKPTNTVILSLTAALRCID
jgi:hypothetical protein